MDVSQRCATMRCVVKVRNDGCVTKMCNTEMCREGVQRWMCHEDVQQLDVSRRCATMGHVTKMCNDEMCPKDIAYLLMSDSKLRFLLHLSPYLNQKLSPNRHRINFEEPVPVWGLERPSSSTGHPSSSTGPVTILVLTYT